MFGWNSEQVMCHAANAMPGLRAMSCSNRGCLPFPLRCPAGHHSCTLGASPPFCLVQSTISWTREKASRVLQEAPAGVNSFYLSFACVIACTFWLFDRRRRFKVRGRAPNRKKSLDFVKHHLHDRETKPGSRKKKAPVTNKRTNRPVAHFRPHTRHDP